MKLRVSEYFVSRKKREGRKGKKTLMKKKLAERQFRSSKKNERHCGRFRKLLASLGISTASSLALAWHRAASRGIARHARGICAASARGTRAASLGVARHPLAPRGRRLARRAADASDRWRGAPSRAALTPARHSFTRNGSPRRSRRCETCLFRGATGARRWALDMRPAALRLSGSAGAGGTLVLHTAHRNSGARSRAWSRIDGLKLRGCVDYTAYLKMCTSPTSRSRS